MLPLTPVPITDEKTAQAVLNLYETLEDHDDVQNVYANFEISDEIVEKIARGRRDERMGSSGRQGG